MGHDAQRGRALRRASLHAVVRTRTRRLRRHALRSLQVASAEQQAATDRARRAQRAAETKAATALQVRRSVQRASLKWLLRGRNVRDRRAVVVVAFQRLRAAAMACTARAQSAVIRADTAPPHLK